MIVQIVPISNLKYDKVTYYTVRVGERPRSEFRDFQDRMSVKPQDLKELNEIRRYIQQMGVHTGAAACHFKHERAADRLPPPYHYIETEDPDDYGLRLYCIRLSNSMVILLNGDRKTALRPEDCKNCATHFKLANRLAVQFNKAIEEGFIELDHDRGAIEIDNDFDLEI